MTGISYHAIFAQGLIRKFIWVDRSTLQDTLSPFYIKDGN